MNIIYEYLPLIFKAIFLFGETWIVSVIFVRMYFKNTIFSWMYLVVAFFTTGVLFLFHLV